MNATLGDVLTLTFDPAETRVDILEDAGVLRLTSPMGIVYEYKYTDASIDYSLLSSGGLATLTLSMEERIPDNRLNSANFKASIGQTSDYKGLPFYMQRLNEFARTFAMAINEGKNLLGQPLNGVIGHVDAYNSYDENISTLFFTYMREDASGVYKQAEYSDFDIYRMTANNFNVNSDLMYDPSLMATRKNSVENGGESENDAVYGFMKLYTDKTLFMQGNIIDFFLRHSG